MVLINNFSLEDNIIGKLYYLIDRSRNENREIVTYFYEDNGKIIIDIPGVENEISGTETEVGITPRFDIGFNPVGSFHTHLYNDMPSTTDIIELIDYIKEHINDRRRIFSNSIMSIGGVPRRNIRCYVPKFLNGIRSPNEFLQELEEIYFKVNLANNRLLPYWREGDWREEDRTNYYRMNDYYMFPIINEYFVTVDI